MALPSIGSALSQPIEELDEFGKPKKQATTFNPLPLTGAGQNVALQPMNQPAQQAAQPAASAGMGSFDPNKPLDGQVVQKAQQVALQGPQTQTQNLVSQQTQNLRKDPNAGIDYNKQNQSQMEAFDFNQQKALEAQRQKTADVSNTGQNLYDLTDLALKTNLDRSGLSSQLTAQSQKDARANLVQALAEGRSTAATEQAGFGAQLSGLATAQSTGSQASDQAFQWAMKNTDQSFAKEMTDIQNKFTSGERVSGQDFASAQASLDRQQQLAIQNNDIQAQQNIAQLQAQLTAKRDEQLQTYQKELQTMDAGTQKELMAIQADIDSNKLMKSQDFEKSMELLNQEFQNAMASGDRAQQIKVLQMQDELEAKRLEKQQEYQTAERVATQAFTSGEKVSERDFLSAQTLLDQKFQAAQQTNDIDAQKYLQGEQLKLQLAMQTNGFNDAEKKMYLQQQIDQAKSQGDYEKTLALQTAANEYDFTKLQSTQGHDVAMADLNNKFETALQAGDFAQAQELQKQSFIQQSKEADKDRAMQQLQIDLQSKGLDMNQWQQNYDAIMAQEEAGTAQPGAARAYLNEQLQGTGVQLEAPDPADEFKAINDAFKIQQAQYLATHPEQAILSPENLAKIKADNPTFTDAQAKNWALQNNPSMLSISPDGMIQFNQVINEATYGEESLDVTSLDGLKAGSDKLKTTIDTLVRSSNPDAVWESYKTKKGNGFDPVILDALIPKSQKAKEFALNGLKDGTVKYTPAIQTVIEREAEAGGKKYTSASTSTAQGSVSYFDAPNTTSGSVIVGQIPYYITGDTGGSRISVPNTKDYLYPKKAINARGETVTIYVRAR
jgi:hypothetical protein